MSDSDTMTRLEAFLFTFLSLWKGGGMISSLDSFIHATGILDVFFVFFFYLELIYF